MAISVIPGLKVLDEIIAGLPTNSAQRLELEKLRLKSANDDVRIKELEAKVAALEPPTEVAVEAAQLLKRIFKAEIAPDVYELTKSSKMEKGVVVHHLRSLSKLGFIKGHHDVLGLERLSVTHEGSTFVLKHLGV